MELDLKERTNCLESQVKQWQLVRLDPDYRAFFDSIPEERFDNNKSYDVTDIFGKSKQARVLKNQFFGADPLEENYDSLKKLWRERWDLVVAIDYRDAFPEGFVFVDNRAVHSRLLNSGPTKLVVDIDLTASNVEIERSLKFIIQRYRESLKLAKEVSPGLSGRVADGHKGGRQWSLKELLLWGRLYEACELAETKRTPEQVYELLDAKTLAHYGDNPDKVDNWFEKLRNSKNPKKK